MIRRKASKGYLLITQNDHAEVAGRIAAHWGNQVFPVPSPRDAVVSAVECHDAGWSIHDDTPTLNEERRPASFYEMPVNWYTRLWVASVSAAAAQGGPMAGLIVSWHFTTLATLIPREDQADPVRNMLTDFMAAQHARRDDYCQALGLSRSMADCPPVASTREDHAAAYNWWLLRACDWLSLQLCDCELPEPMRAPPSMNGPTSAPLSARRTGDGNLVLEPWPLEVERLSLELSAKRVPSSRYRTQADLLRAYQCAPVEKLRYDLVPSC